MSTKKSFAEHPKAEYWHPTKNGDTNPNMVSYGSAKKCWFKCPNKNCLHDFIVDPNHVTALKNPTWCPYCCQAPKKLCIEDDCKICHERSFASHPMSSLWFQEKNGNITARSIFVSSNKKYWLKCNDNSCSHLFEVCIANITSGESHCPYCAHKRLCEDITCEPCMRRSFASHLRSKNWDYTQNGDIIPRNIFKTGHESYWFICDNNHSFRDNLGHITCKTRPRWCSICLKDNELQVRSQTYLGEARKIAEERDGKLISTVYTDCHTLLEWKCNTCQHEWSSSFTSIKHGESWCPKCAGNFKLNLKECQLLAESKEGLCISEQYINNSINMKWMCKEEHKWDAIYSSIKSGSWCPYCINHAPKTLEDAKRAAEEKGGECISTEYIDSHTKMKWRCKKKHEWDASYNNVSRLSWCPYCVNKTEQKLYEKLIILYPKLNIQYKVDWCKNKTFLPFDFVIEELKIIIELDGPQHFIQVSNWKSPEETQKVDLYKMKCANDNGFSVIRLTQEDVYYDKYNWLNELDIAIKEIVEEKTVQHIYLCMNNEYEEHNNL
jgi:very-short-patch-repair endonuclease